MGCVSTSRFEDMSRSTERPGNYLFKIESFSLLLHALKKTNRVKYDSCHFEAGGYEWKLSLYPKGDKKRGGHGYLSLYLALADPESLPRGGEVHVMFKFFVFDYLRDNYLVLQDGRDRRFHEFNTEWGFAKLLSRKKFKDSSQGYLVNDCCMFGVEMFFHYSASEGRSSRSIMNNVGPYGTIFTWKIDKFSTLPALHMSKEFTVGGLKWALQLYPEGDSRTKGRNLSLFLVVHDHSSFPSGWSIYAEYKLSILDQRNKKHHERTVGGKWFNGSTSTSTTCGYSEFIQLSDLKNASRGFIVNDNAVIQVIFTTIIFNGLP